MACEAASRCGCLDIYDLEMCHAFQRAKCYVEIQEPCDSGRRAYDSLQAGRCLQHQSAEMADCIAGDIASLPGCNTMLVGQVPAGTRCYRTADCAAGLECVQQVCAAMPAVNQPCLQSVGCATGQFCDRFGLCRHLGEAGADCHEGEHACARELYCDVRADKCSPLLQLGKSCAHPRARCARDLFCHKNGICHAQNQVVERCEAGADCSAAGCSAGDCGNEQSVCTFLPVRSREG